jgi:hypothetical protein
MGKIKIVCKRGIGGPEGNSGHNRPTVYLDKKVIGIIQLGESCEFEIERGRHNLQVKIGIYSSKELVFTTMDNGFKHFSIGNNYSYFTLGIIYLLISVVSVIILSVTNNLNFFPLVITMVVIYFFNLIFLKSGFLKIEEISPYRK